MGIISSTTTGAGISFMNLARLVAACRRTMGVSSWTSWLNCCRSCSWICGDTFLYGLVKRPQPETLDVNQSALASRMVRGTKYSSTCFGDSSLQILFNDSTACKGQLRAPGVVVVPCGESGMGQPCLARPAPRWRPGSPEGTAEHDPTGDRRRSR